jgi:hypothetical protein
VSYADIVNGLSPEQIRAVKNTGTIIVTEAVPQTVSVALVNVLLARDVNF